MQRSRDPGRGDDRAERTRRSLLERSRPRRYGALLLIPLRPAGLVTLVVLSTVLVVSLKAGPFGVPLILILLSWFFKYSFVFLDRLVGGETEAPVLSVEMIVASMGEFRFLVPLILVLVAFLASGVGAFLLGAVAAAVAAIGLVMCLPAALAVQAWTGRLRDSLNPRVCRVMARSLGDDYVWSVGCTFAVTVVCVFLPAVVGAVPWVVRVALLLYAWLAVIAAIGGAVYANRKDLEARLPLNVPRALSESLEERARRRERWVDSIYAAWRGNALDGAWRSVMDRIESSAEPLEELLWLCARVAAWQPAQFSNRTAQETVRRLLGAGREGEALELARERLAIDPDFEPSTSEEARRLAKLAEQWGDSRTAEALGSCATK